MRVAPLRLHPTCCRQISRERQRRCTVDPRKLGDDYPSHRIGVGVCTPHLVHSTVHSPTLVCIVQRIPALHRAALHSALSRCKQHSTSQGRTSQRIVTLQTAQRYAHRLHSTSRYNTAAHAWHTTEHATRYFAHSATVPDHALRCPTQFVWHPIMPSLKRVTHACNAPPQVVESRRDRQGSERSVGDRHTLVPRPAGHHFRSLSRHTFL
jgi:hypothetical protein